MKTLNALFDLWDQLRDIPVDDGGFLEQPFLHFGVGVHREDVWHWFEEQNPGFIVGDVQQNYRGGVQ